MLSKYIDAIDLTIADSFVMPSNKIGGGNGEAKLYVGQRTSQQFTDFFGVPGFRIDCRIRKSDMLRFLDDMKPEYFNPTYPYRDSAKYKTIWKERRLKVSALPDEENDFIAEDQTQLSGPRGYVNSDSPYYDFLRTLPLPNTSRLKILKYEIGKRTIFEFKLIADHSGNFGSSIDSLFEAGILDEIENDPALVNAPRGTVVDRIVKARVGQSLFRRVVLIDCEFTCPFTGVQDPGMLNAGHIKPWSKSNDKEKVDEQNGLALTPTYDKLFNDGLISFNDDRTLMVSPLLSRDTAKKLNLLDDDVIDVPLLGDSNKRRRIYMAYHRENIFRS